MPPTQIAWFRRDLRLDDNPAWAAATSGGTAVALVVIEPGLLERAGPFRRRYYLDALRGLDAELRGRGGCLRVEHGDPAELVPRVAASVGASAVHVNADVTRWAKRRDGAVRADLGDTLIAHWGTLVHRPGTVLTKAGTLSRVFTPFHRAWTALDLPAACHPGSATLADDPGDGWREREATDGPEHRGPEALLTRFLEVIERYPTDRDIPALAGTSQLSAALRFGTISARRLARDLGTETPGRAAFVRQLAWRDWYAHLTHEQPDIDRVALRAEYDSIPWETGADADAAFDAWRAGRTGYPIVDAGMRELAATGAMHNRVRMIAASFLVKDLLIDWRRGERWFRHLLCDGDIPQNAGNWQWVAGTGPDAAPYFRVFNPTLQSKKFDPDGVYLRNWLPELAALPTPGIHEPAAMAPLDLAAAGVTLGTEYPHPIVDHSAAKEETLVTYKRALDAARGGEPGAK